MIATTPIANSDKEEGFGTAEMLRLTRTILLISIALVQLAVAESSCATEQIRDRIAIDGNSYQNQAVMRGLWRKHSEEPDGRDLMPHFESRSTANRRGYWAKFAIKNGELLWTQLHDHLYCVAWWQYRFRCPPLVDSLPFYPPSRFPSNSEKYHESYFRFGDATLRNRDCVEFDRRRVATVSRPRRSGRDE